MEKKNVTHEVYAKLGLVVGNSLPNQQQGYSLVYYTKKEECLCGNCATSWDNELDLVSYVGVYEEGPILECIECGTDIYATWHDEYNTD